MKNIFLIGMPSSGKTSLGKALAGRIGYTFLDLDAVIVKKERRSIADIFKQDGEGYFRRVESETLKEIRPDQGLVIATGGGTPCFFDNMDFIKNQGFSLYLDVSPGELLRRMQHSYANDRPLYNTQNDADTLLQTLETKYRDRAPFYQRADAQLRGDQLTIGQVMELLQAKELR